MGKETKISWTDATVNFWTGCVKVSKACRFCYMYRDKERYGVDPKKVLRTKDNTFRQALNWKEGKKIFTCSWSDFFIEEADQWREDAWKIIKSTPQHTWQILTKRPERIKQCLPADWAEGYDNVWLGVSVEDQQRAQERIPILTDIPAKVRFLSCEPLLEYIDLEKWLSPCGYYCAHSDQEYDAFINSDEFSEMDETERADACASFYSMHHHPKKSEIHWVIVGGESGFGKKAMDPDVKYKYRECKMEWIRSIYEQCNRHGTPVFVKQLGTHLAKQMGLKSKTGADIEELGFPPYLIDCQQFPKTQTEKV